MRFFLDPWMRYRSAVAASSRVEKPDLMQRRERRRRDRTLENGRLYYAYITAPATATARNRHLAGASGGFLSRGCSWRPATNRCFRHSFTDGLLSGLSMQTCSRKSARSKTVRLSSAPAFLLRNVCAIDRVGLSMDTRVNRGSFVLSSSTRCWNLNEDCTSRKCGSSSSNSYIRGREPVACAQGTFLSTPS